MRSVQGIVLGKMKNEKSKKTLYMHILFWAVGILMFTLFTCLFYWQAVKYKGIYLSDLPAHIKFAVEKRGYSLLYFFIGIIYRTTDRVFLIAVFESLLIIFTWLISGKLICRLIGELSFPAGCFIGLPLIFLTGIYIPFIYGHFYSGQLVAQPWHNITYFGMRLFAVAAMLVFVNMIDTYVERNSGKRWVMFTFLLMLSTAVKPSFLYGFSFTLLLFLCVDAIKLKFEKKALINIVAMGFTVIPSLLILLFQSSILYGTAVSEGGTGIVLIWGANFIKEGFIDTILKIVCSLAFPILVLIKNRKNLKKIDKFVYIMYFVQLMVVILFSESGKRRFDGNFYWGLYLGAYILYIFVHAKFWEDVLKKPGKDKRYKIIGFVLMSVQFISGIVYFSIVISGRNFLV